jgi:hypothetical protein
MKHSIRAGVGIVAAALAFTAALGPVTASASVQRPWVEHGSYRLTADFSLVEGSLLAFDAHLGKVTDDGSAITAANGDTLRYAPTDFFLAEQVADFPKCKRGYLPGWEQDYVFVGEGSTGRFEGASGSTRSWNCMRPRADGGWDIEYTSRGTLTY